MKLSSEIGIFCFFQRQFLQLCFKYASEQIIVKIGCSKYQTLFKTLIRNIFQDMYCHAQKTATLTPIQHTVPPPSLKKNHLWMAPKVGCTRLSQFARSHVKQLRIDSSRDPLHDDPPLPRMSL